MIQSGLARDRNQAIDVQKDLIESGKALRSFEVSVATQGGKLEKLKSSTKPMYETLILSKSEGVVNTFDTEEIGWALVELGCVKKRKQDDLDHSAGIEFLKKTGDPIIKNEPVYRVFNSNKKTLDNAAKMLIKTINCGKRHADQKLIFDNA